MTGFKRLFVMVFVTMMLIVVTVLVFGSETKKVTAVTTQSHAEMPAGLTDFNWQKIKNQLSGLLDEVKLTASDAQAFDQFGHSVDISGDIIVVGNPDQDSGPGNASGAAYIFERPQGSPVDWGEVIKLTADDPQPYDWFGWAVAISGDTVVVGVPGYEMFPLPGSAYVFDRDAGGPGTWGQVAELIPDDVDNGDQFGFSVDISGDTIVVGTAWEDGGPGNPINDAGATYIFERNQGGSNNWGQVVKLTANDSQAGDYFGRSVAVGGDTVVISSPGEDGGPGDPLPDAGAAYIFERNQGGPNNWGEVGKLSAGDAQVSDGFGLSVALSGNTVVVGTWIEHGGPGDPLPAAGAAYIFERDQGGANNWGQVAKLTAGDAQAEDRFGDSLDVNGDTVVVGARYEDGGFGDPLSNSGAAYIFMRHQGGVNVWGQVVKQTAGDPQSGDFFGQSVAISGETIVIGAIGEDGGPGNPITNAGAAYVYWNIPDNFGYLPVILGQ